MASVRLNVFENIPVLQNLSVGALLAVNRGHLQGINIPGSISFNNAAVLVSGAGGGTMSISLGLYSLSGSTLSIANSASNSIAPSAGISWVSLVTSATQDITPGNWYFLVQTESGGANSNTLFVQAVVSLQSFGPIGGPLIRGVYSTTNAIAGSFNTSEFNIEGGVAASTFRPRRPYILISA